MENNKQTQKKQGRAWHFLASANSGTGFDNRFDQINIGSKKGFMYILKGGPGTGKSTLMKNIATEFLSKGEDIEYFYCSSDYSSLDGIRLVNHNIAIVDGTKPHVTECSMVGVRDKIINLDICISDKIKKYEKEIASLQKKKNEYFDLAYMYIKNAKTYNDSCDTIYSKNLTIPDPQKEANNILSLLKLNKETNKKIQKKPQYRRLSISLVADDGIVSFVEKNAFEKNITLNYSNQTNILILEKLLESFSNLKLDLILFTDILSPLHHHGIYIKEKNICICKAEYKFVPTFDHILDKYLEYNHSKISSNLREAANAILDAKSMHKQIEEYYIQNVDFSIVDSITKNLITKINKEIM